jgi:hypothetical protein
MVSAAGYALAAKQKHSISFVATIRDLFPEDDDDDVPSVSKQDMEELRKLIPAEYHDHMLFFTKKEADKLPPHRYIDIRKKRSCAHVGLCGSRGLRGVAVDRVGGERTRLRNATCMRTLRTLGFSRQRERPDVDIPRALTWTAYGIPGVAEVKANMERAHTSVGYITEEPTDGI